MPDTVTVVSPTFVGAAIAWVKVAAVRMARVRREIDNCEVSGVLKKGA